MENIPEREQTIQEKVISLNEEFRPFEHPRLSHSRFYEHESSVILSPNENVNLPIVFATDKPFREESPSVLKVLTVSPFEPELAYQITSEDFDIESRRNKVEQLYKEHDRYINRSKIPLALDVRSNQGELQKAGCIKKSSEGYYYLSPETLDILRKLRLLVSFPNGSFEAKPSGYEGKQKGIRQISFYDFYPVYSGPLPVGKLGELMPPGFMIAMPSDPEKLSQIRARFVLVEDQPNELDQT